jgi:hypothetical protein
VVVGDIRAGGDRVGTDVSGRVGGDGGGGGVGGAGTTAGGGGGANGGLAAVLLAADSDEDDVMGGSANLERDEGRDATNAGQATDDASAATTTAEAEGGGASTDFISSMLVSAYEMSENAKKGEQRLQRKAILDELDGWMGGGGDKDNKRSDGNDDDDNFLPGINKAKARAGDVSSSQTTTMEASPSPPRDDSPSSTAAPRGSARSRRDDASTPVKRSGGGEGKGRTLSEAVSFIDKRRADYYAQAIGGKQRAMSSGGQAALENLARAATPASLGLVGDGSVAVAIPLLTPATSMQDVGSAGGGRGGATRAEVGGPHRC